MQPKSVFIYATFKAPPCLRFPASLPGSAAADRGDAWRAYRFAHTIIRFRDSVTRETTPTTLPIKPPTLPGNPPPISSLYRGSLERSAVAVLVETQGWGRPTAPARLRWCCPLWEYGDVRRRPFAYALLLYCFGAGFDRFYDDNIWLGIDLADLHRNPSAAFSTRRSVSGFIASGTDDKLGGGIYWCEKKVRLNTCSNARATFA